MSNLNLHTVLELKYHSAIVENGCFSKQSHPQSFVSFFKDEGLFFYRLDENP
jgi:hypothetical protein